MHIIFMYVDWDAGVPPSQTCMFAGKKRGNKEGEREKRERGKIKRYI